MSYDLYFKLRQPKSIPGKEAIATYFRQRKNYKVSETQAWYENAVTGAYFVFDFVESKGGEQADFMPATLNVNYFRPHFFGLEAAPEVKAFVEKFDLLIFDPQTNGMDGDEFSTNGFLSGWNHGNAFAYRAMISQKPEQRLLTLPTAKIEACWRWNRAKDELQEQLGEGIFVPRLLFIDRAGSIATTVAWPDGIPIAFPESDTVLIKRKQILPKSPLQSVEDIVLAEWSDVEPILRDFPLKQGALPYRLLSYTSVPAAVASKLREFQAIPDKPIGVHVDRILNAELVEIARNERR